MPKYIDEPELELKRKFAAELLANPTQAWLIATRRFPDDMARRYVVLSWIKDPVVLQIQRELRIRAEQAPLPSARRAYELLADETASVPMRLWRIPLSLRCLFASLVVVFFSLASVMATSEALGRGNRLLPSVCGLSRRG